MLGRCSGPRIPWDRLPWPNSPYRILNRADVSALARAWLCVDVCSALLRLCLAQAVLRVLLPPTGTAAVPKSYQLWCPAIRLTRRSCGGYQGG